MIGLSRDSLGRRFFQGSVLFERFMIGFHVPSFAIESGHLVGGQGRIAGHEILNSGAGVFVCEDLLGEQEREIDTFKVDFQNRIPFECQLVEAYLLTVTFSLLTQGDFAIGLEGHDKVFVQVVLDEHHVIGGAVPDIAQDVLKRNLVPLGVGQQLPVVFVFADGRTAFLFAILFIEVVFRFRYDLKADWQTIAARMVQTRHEVDALHPPVLAVVVMPTDNIVLIRVRLFRNTIIDDDYSICLLDLPYIWLHDLPQLGRPQPFFRQQPLNLVMAHPASQQPSQPSSRRLSKRTDEIFAIDVQQFFVVHPISLAYPCVR
jgi:hypothetical protein